jgi:hypothetical protein
LPPDLQQSNYDNAAAIPAKLKCLGLGLRRAHRDGPRNLPVFTREEIELLSRREHERWCWQRRLQGWIYRRGKKNDAQKTTPYLIPYERLTEKIKEYDRETVRLIPKLLAQAGYEVYRLPRGRQERK